MWFPRRAEDLKQSGLKVFQVRDFILNTLYVQGATRGADLAEIYCVPFHLIEPEIRHLKDTFQIGPVGGAGISGYNAIDWALTKQGRELAAEVHGRVPYIGAAPVDITDYLLSVQKQKFQSRSVKREMMDKIFKDMVVNASYVDRIGPAINSGGPIFLYGKPGNGKTLMAEQLSRLFRQGMFVPQTIQVDGQLIKFFDEKVHKPIPLEKLPEDHVLRTDPRSVDRRWIYVYRPFITVGGELTLPMLDLIYKDAFKYYEAPFQMKANCGVLLVDDFGRQIVRPKDFLNRWVYPLEKGVDFLTLVTGKKIEVPFDPMLIFSTNLEPKDLADEAFWRRIKYKIEIPGPTSDEFKAIFRRYCERINLSYDENAFRHLDERYYKGAKREYRAVHPRDILRHVRDYVTYLGRQPALTPELIDMACEAYFGQSGAGAEQAWGGGVV